MGLESRLCPLDNFTPGQRRWFRLRTEELAAAGMPIAGARLSAYRAALAEFAPRQPRYKRLARVTWSDATRAGHVDVLALTADAALAAARARLASSLRPPDAATLVLGSVQW